VDRRSDDADPWFSSVLAQLDDHQPVDLLRLPGQERKLRIWRTGMKNLKRPRGHITAEMRELAIRALRNREVTQKQLSEELGVSTRSLRDWLRASEREENNEPLKKAERIELEQLRRETKRLREENEILKKFQAFSAKGKR
jgi:transposase